jgi:octaprenyl-diphosphate synthase
MAETRLHPSHLSFVANERLQQELSVKLQALEQLLTESLESNTPLVPLIGTHILRGGGKRIRPLLLMLTARASGYEGSEEVMLASLTEWIHAATLLHDDVLDEADLRRDQPTVRRMWGNRLSVSMGNYAYFYSATALIRMANTGLASCLLQACEHMALGELMQLEQGNKPSEYGYLRIIEYKTGALMAATCQAGGILADATKADCQALYRFGLAVGIAFQLLDDAQDYVTSAECGKRPGQDLRQGVVTLPLLHLLRHCTESERKALHDFLLTRACPEEAFDSISRLLLHYGSIKHTFALAHRYRDIAKIHLKGLKESIYKDGLLTFADSVLVKEASLTNPTNLY